MKAAAAAADGRRRLYSIIVDNNNVVAPIARHQPMEPKIIKEEAIERDTSVLDEPAINNNNNKESAFRIHTRKSKIKSKDAGFSSTSTSDSSGEHLLSPTHPLPAQIDGESESSSPPSDTFRNHSNIKRFLTTLVQFSGQVSPQTSDRVKGQIFTLVNNMISVEEFHHNIQEMTNFPLRPFVLPFLRTHLPSLQRDLLAMARSNKQTLSQYLKQHENAYLDRDSQPSEPSEIFHQVERVPAPSPMAARENNNNNNNNNNGGGGHKRPYPLAAAAAAMTAMQAAADGYYDAGYTADLDYQQPCVKRPNLGYGVPFMYHHHHPPPPPPQPPHGHPHPHPHPHLHPQEPPPPPPPSSSASASAAPHPYNMLPLLHIRDADQDPHKGHVEDEWKNIHVMLNCILSMVEKTKKALGILQERGLTDTNFPDWNRKKSTEEVLALTVRQTEERIESIKKKAEDSMNEIRHQAMVELQKLVLAAENRMVELVAVERTRTSGNRSSGGASLQISPSSLISQYNSCWNCGRKAHETCSGCNTAQYCSSFCQHKDWDTHHQTCCVHSAAAAAAASATAIGTTVSTTVAATTTATTSSSITAANCSGITAANSAGHHQQQQQQQPSAVKKHQQPPPPPSSSAVTADDLSVNRQPPQSTVASSSSSSSTSSSSASASAGDFDKQQQLQQPSAAVTASTVMTTAAAATVTANGDGGGGGGGKRQ